MNQRSVRFLFSIVLIILPASLVLSGYLSTNVQGNGSIFQSTPKPPVTVPDDNEVNRVAREMYCPVCENIPLDVCPTQACNEWRELIRLKLSEGWSDEQIKEYFVVQYGDRVLAEPPMRGLNWLVYILPVIFFLAGVYILYRVLDNMRRSSVRVKVSTRSPGAGTSDRESMTSVPASQNLDDIYLRRLEEELKKSK
jgi:cytochrome c-type biogenesis protein CcmH